jgi:hypothetical protein
MSRRGLLSPFGPAYWTSFAPLLIHVLIVGTSLFPSRGEAQDYKLKVDEANVKILLTRAPEDVVLPIENLISQVQKTVPYVLPDRVVVYLWPCAGGTEFNFKFRPRMAMTAKGLPLQVTTTTTRMRKPLSHREHL